MKRYIQWTVYALAVLMPIFFLPWVSSAVEFNKQTLLIIAAVVSMFLWVADAIKKGKLEIKKSIFNWLFLIFLGAIILASIFSLDGYTSIFGTSGTGYTDLISFVSLLVISFMIINNFEGAETKKLIKLFLISSFIAIFLGLLGILNIPVFKLFGLSDAGRTFNTMGSANALGILGALNLVLALGLTKIYKGALKVFAIVSGVVSFILLAVLNWWIIWVAALIGLVLSFSLSSLRGGYKMKNFIVPGILIALIVVIMVTKIDLGVKNNLAAEVSPTYKTSLGITLKSWGQSPVWGLGLENFGLAYDSFRPSSINDTSFWSVRFGDATSEVFNLATNTGILGLLAFLALIVFGFAGFIRKGMGQGSEETDSDSPEIEILIPAFATIVVGFLLYPFNLTLYFALFMLLGVIVSSIKPVTAEIDLEGKPRNSAIASLVFIVLIIGVIIGVYFAGQQYVAEVAFAKAQKETDTQKLVERMVNVYNINKGDSTYARALSNVLIERIGEELKNTTDKAEDVQTRIQNLSATSIDLAKRATDSHPSDSLNWLNRGYVYQNLVGLVSGAEDWAVKAYDEYNKLVPNNPLGFNRLGNVYLTKVDLLKTVLSQSGKQGGTTLTESEKQTINGQIEENLLSAETNFKKAIELKKDFSAAIYSLGVVYEREDKLAEAIAQLESAQVYSPTDSSLAFELGLLYQRNNQKNLALASLEKAVQLYPDYSNALWYLGLMYEERGEIAKAIETIKKVETLNPDNETVKEKLTSLQSGKRDIPPEKVTETQPVENP